jgi:hypothetical protein
MITLKKCKNILEQKGNKYTEQEVEFIYDFLSQVAEIQYQYLISNTKKKM